MAKPPANHPQKIKELNDLITREGKRWRAADTAVSRLDLDRFKRMLGWSPMLTPPSAMDEHPLHPRWSPGDAYDKEVDWRNRNGKNFVTPIKDQGGCGTCVAFAVNAEIESMALIEKGLELSLSEADLAFNGSHAADCSGWEQGLALADAKSTGVVSEKRLPYDSVFLPTDDSWLSPPSREEVPDKADFAVRVNSFSNIYSVADRKSYLTHVGPLTCGITAYSDLPYYSSGVYAPTGTAVGIGGHCILIIGYSEANQCWLFKNSWGTNWGQNGFGAIAYGVCDIDTETDKVKTYFTSCGGVQIPEGVLDEDIRSFGTSRLKDTPQPDCCDGFYSPDDKMRHVITGTSAGDIFETFFNPTAGTGQAHLINVGALRDLGSFYTNDDSIRHVIALDPSGKVSEVYYSPKSGVSTTGLGNIDGGNKVCGFYTPDDHFRHAIVGAASGDIFEIFYGKGKGQSKLTTIPDLMDIAGFYSPDDQFRHVISASLDGTIRETFYHPKKGNHTAVLAKIPGVKRIGAFYAPKDKLYSRRVQVLYDDGGTRKVCELRYSSQSIALRNELGATAGAVDLGGFYSDDDQMSHCVIGFSTGESRELFY